VAVNDNWAYLNTTTTGATTNVGTFMLPAITSGAVYVGGGNGGSVQAVWPAPEPKPQSALEWLDAEVEATCALARAA